MPIIRTIAQSVEIHYSYSMHQLMETAITISHYAHTLIAKKSYAILDQFSAFHKILYRLATQHTI